MVIESLGGYRLVRKLGEGPRAEVFLAHPLRDHADALPAAIKVTRAGVDPASVLAEASALTRAVGNHVVALLDVAPGPGVAHALILDRLAGGSLARLLRDRSRLRAGEAITILAPLAGAVSRLHDEGVVHGAIRADTVLFDADGAPVLACFGRARLVDPGLSPAARESEAGITDDVRAVAALARTVLAAAGSAGELLDWVESSVEFGTDDWLGSFAARLFDLGEAEAVDLRAGAPAYAEGRVPARLVIGSPIMAVEPRQALPAWADGLLPAGMGDTIAPVVQRLRSALSTVRRPLWLMAGAVAVTLVAAIALVSPGDSDAASSPPVSPTATGAPAVDAGPVGANDPVAALSALLETRERCIRELSVLCLDDVDQEGSAALEADQQLVRGLQDGAEVGPSITVDDGEAALVERLGDSAIVSLGDSGGNEPASVLLMKGEAGWRIRDYLE